MASAPTMGSTGRDEPDSSLSTETEAGRRLVKEQLDRMLTSPVFRNSRRLSGFLRYVVEETVDNSGADLKERNIGVHVFKRSPGYDTNGDPVVRVSAGHLRRRIAQYYSEPGRGDELRIDFPVGSYRPVFQWHGGTPTNVVSGGRSDRLVPPGTADLVAPQWVPGWLARRHSHPLRFYALLGSLIVLAGVAVALVIKTPIAYDQFWGPVVNASGPVLVYVGARPDDDRIVYEDAVALADLTANLIARNRTYRILRQPAITPDELKKGPSLLIGGFTNPLSRRLTQQLRFTFASEDDATGGFSYIQDRQYLDRKEWAVKRGPLGASAEFTDYAIISRAVDPVTGRIAVVSAGIRKYGTFASAEFLSHPEQIQALARNAPRDWRKQNMQAVLAVRVRAGRADPARLVASYFW